MNVHAFFDELRKLGAISDEHAQASLDRLESLDRTRRSTGQIARYAGLGAATAPVIGALGNAVRGKGFRGGLRGTEYLRDVAGNAVAGSLGMGAVPVLQNHLDRRAELGTLRKYVQEKTGAGAPTREGFLMASDVPASRRLRVEATAQPEHASSASALGDGVTYKAGDFVRSKYASASPFAAARAAKAVGVMPPKSPTASLGIRDIAKPRGAGFGSGIPGAFAGSLGGQGPVDLRAGQLGPKLAQRGREHAEQGS
ncbi:hypothetical protein LVJ94_35375 [Pendulispora rubella]|uniref:Uncharacterized protein n=1 Tax=Pendulispora rubella TaxID=2741070 RepID=A0ABZ2KVS9_9BACT